MAEITLHPEHRKGAVKPLHGVCNGPISMGGWTDMSEEYREMGVPFVRLHDTDYPYPQQVDLPQIFRNPDADPDDPAAYDFFLTDQFITAIHNTGAEIIYRLGSSIEHMPGKRWVHPPEPAKFAAVCEHVVRHYNEGWANGYTYGIRRWEIWNEPEDHDGARRCMWTGTKAQYFELYNTTAKHLKAVFGDSIAVGGYAACGFYGMSRDATPKHQALLDYFYDFVASIKAAGAPLDFFSYHYYGTDPEAVRCHATRVADYLGAAGYPDAELIVDEWNSSASTKELGWITTMRGARYVLDMMAAFTRSPVAIATYYDGQPHMAWCGLFDRLRNKMKPFYAFCLYDRLYRLGTRIAVKSDRAGAVLAATDGEKIGLLIVGGEAAERVTVRGFAGEVEAVILDETRDLAPIAAEREGDAVCVDLPAGAVVWMMG